MSFVDNVPTLCDQLLLAYPQGHLSGFKTQHVVYS